MTSKAKVASSVSVLRHKQSSRKKRPNISNTGITGNTTGNGIRLSSTRSSASASDIFTARNKREGLHDHELITSSTTPTTTPTKIQNRNTMHNTSSRKAKPNKARSTGNLTNRFNKSSSTNFNVQKLNKNANGTSTNNHNKPFSTPRSPKSPKSPGSSPTAIAKKLAKSLRSGLKNGSPEKNDKNGDSHLGTASDPVTNNKVDNRNGNGKGAVGSSMVSPTSERVVLGDEKFDGIEVAMKEYEYRDDSAHGEVEMEVELMHVLGKNSMYERGNGYGYDEGSDKEDGSYNMDDATSTSPTYDLKQQKLSWLGPVSLPGIHHHDERVGMVDQHCSVVEHARMCTRYHPTCDFTLQHRIPTSSLDHRSHHSHVNNGSHHHHHNSTQSFSDNYAILQKYQSKKEDEVVGKEWMQLCSEIKAIENESNKILAKLEPNATKKKSVDKYMSIDGHRRKYHECTETNCRANFDINLYLDDVDPKCSNNTKSGNGHGHTHNKRVFKPNHKSSQTKDKASNQWKCPDQQHRSYLQKRRGAHIHAGFSYPNHVKMFAMKCEGNMKAGGECHKSLASCETEMYGIEKGSSKACDVRHVAITVGDGGTASFFVSKDDGKAHHDDTVPRRLMERIEKETANGNYLKRSTSNINIFNSKSKQKNIRYLACGPNRSYYAELVSGLVLWSIGKHDGEFQQVMKKMNVHRVAFGSFDTDTSWIAIGKDGGVVWRNIPCRLNQKLLARTSEMPAPCEISLGAEGSYFIRFLDGEIDYCLPAYMEDIVSKILHQGAEVTNIALHPESAHAFIIRHSMLRT